MRVEARADLYDALVVDDLVGSATRVAFARVGHIRTILGCPPEDLTTADDADKFVLDDKYLHIDISVHWACNGLLLAFFHAAKDKDPQLNNDVRQRENDLWTNFCGTAVMPENQIETLWTRISEKVNYVQPPLGTASPDRIFMICTTPQSEVRPDDVIFAWPPPRIPIDTTEDGSSAVGSLFDVPKLDGSYSSAELLDVLRKVRFDAKDTDKPWGQYGRSSCTARFAHSETLYTEGLMRQIDCLFIPYGNIVFASFQIIACMSLSEFERRSSASAAPSIWGLADRVNPAALPSVDQQGQPLLDMPAHHLPEQYGWVDDSASKQVAVHSLWASPTSRLNPHFVTSWLRGAAQGTTNEGDHMGGYDLSPAAGMSSTSGMPSPQSYFRHTDPAWQILTPQGATTTPSAQPGYLISPSSHQSTRYQSQPFAWPPQFRDVQPTVDATGSAQWTPTDLPPRGQVASFPRPSQASEWTSTAPMETRHSFDQLGAPILPVIAAAGPSGWDNDVASSKFGGTVKQQLVDDPIPQAAGAFDWSANVPADDRRDRKSVG